MENQKGICLQPYIPVRREASERSEMVTQLLFGELFLIQAIEKDSGFALIKNELDHYEGWVDEKTITSLSREKDDLLKSYPIKICHKRAYRLVDSMKNEMWLSAGSLLRVEPDKTIYGTKSMYNQDSEEEQSREFIEDLAREWINVSYLWGGKSTFGTDCSGIVQNLCGQIGINLPRDADDQSCIGKAVNFIFEAQPGDLAFFSEEEERITHVGMILSRNRIIHASGKVRIDLFDQQGIYSREKSNYTHRLRLMRNVFD